MSIYNKLNTRITNITFIYEQVHPWRRKEGGKRGKEAKIKAYVLENFNVNSY